MCLVSLFDGTMFFGVAILIVFAGFDNDYHSGTKAKQKGKELDAKDKEDMKALEEKKKALGKTQ